MSRRGLNPTTVARGRNWDARRGDAYQNLQALSEATADAIITSPPYYGVADYVKSQRLTFLWYHPAVANLEGFDDDFEQYRKEEIGSRSFRHRRGSFDDYIEYMNRFIQASARVLKSSGKLCLVIGESQTREPTLSAIMRSACDAGLRLAFSLEAEYSRHAPAAVGKYPTRSAFDLC